MKSDSLIIPEQGNPNYELKLLRRGKPLVDLPDNKKAIYIGSNPVIDTVTHILPLVDSYTYILSDLLFKEAKREAKFKDCSVITTNKNGFEVLEEDSDISFIMLDQAVEGLKEHSHKIGLGAWLFMHTIFPDHQWTVPFYQYRLGVEQSNLHKFLFRKNRITHREDLSLANDLVRILSDLDDYSDVSFGVSKYMNFSPLWQRKEEYPSQGFVEGTKEIVKLIEELNPKLNDLEKRVLKEQIEKTKEELSKKDCKAHAEMKVILEKLQI